MTELVKNNDDVREFLRLVEGARANLEAAGKLAARLCDADPTFPDRVCDANPNYRPEMVKRLADVGRGRLHIAVFLSDAPGMRRLSQLSYDQQEKYSKEPIPLLTKTPAGWETLSADVRNLVPQQADQVFDLKTKSVRSEAAQRAWIEARTISRLPAPKTDEKWTLVRGAVVINVSPMRVTPRVMHHWLKLIHHKGRN